MGLFSFKKKTEQPDFSPPTMPSVGTASFPAMNQPSDFDFMPKPNAEAPRQVPMPPPGMLPPIGTQEEMSPLPPIPAAPAPSESKQLPTFDIPLQANQPSFPLAQEPAFLPKPDFTQEKPQALPPLPEVQVAKQPVDWTKEAPAKKEEDFELPDFDDEELKQIQRSAQQQEKKQSVELPKIDFTEELAPAKFNPKLQQILTPPKKTEGTPLPAQERYLELSAFFDIRDELTHARTIARSVEEEMFAQNYKEKLDSYAQLAACLGSIQDRLMLVESKIFDNRQEEF